MSPASSLLGKTTWVRDQLGHLMMIIWCHRLNVRQRKPNGFELRIASTSKSTVTGMFSWAVWAPNQVYSADLTEQTSLSCTSPKCGAARGLNWNSILWRVSWFCKVGAMHAKSPRSSDSLTLNWGFWSDHSSARVPLGKWIAWGPVGKHQHPYTRGDLSVQPW